MQIIRRLILVLSLGTLILASWLAPLDTVATQQVDAGLKRALVSFATARALNAVISVAQGTEVSVQPLGVGLNFAPGQILDPVNDLVEQFSNLMLVASVAFGVQKVLIVMGGYWLISLVLTAVTLGWAWFYFRQRPSPVWLSRLLVILLMVRFAVPAVNITTDWMFQQFLAEDYETSQKGIDGTSGQIATLTPPVLSGTDNQGLLENTRHWWSQNVDVKARFESLKQTAEQATEKIIKLIVIFLLQTLLIPLLLFWALYRVARGCFVWPRINPAG